MNGIPLALGLIVVGVIGNLLAATVILDRGELWGYLQFIGSGFIFTLFNLAIGYGMLLLGLDDGLDNPETQVPEVEIPAVYHGPYCGY